MITLVRTIVVAGLLVLTTACCSAPEPDPHRGVSAANYRRAVANAADNLRGVVEYLEKLERDDLSSPRPRHSAEWWAAQTGLMRDTLDMLDGTLQGARTLPGSIR